MKIDITFDQYADYCIQRCRDSWNGREEEALNLVLDTMEEIYSEDDALPDVCVLVDNLIVNSQIINRREFCEGGEASWAWEDYRGDWDRLCEDCFCSNENLAVMDV